MIRCTKVLCIILVRSACPIQTTAVAVDATNNYVQIQPICAPSGNTTGQAGLCVHIVKENAIAVNGRAEPSALLMPVLPAPDIQVVHACVYCT